ncbi:MAG TPA: TIGR02757 family protein [Thermoanaerobaculia bacterium]|nr:TIGR02757 family protein [Thermoanaerobaculia bacterium]
MKRRLRLPDVPALASHLHALEEAWRGKRLDSDPLLFPHRYERPDDREVAAFLASSLAFGRVASINASLERLFGALGPHPASALRKHGDEEAGPDGFVHRWVDAGSLRPFLRAIGETLRAEGSLGALLASGDEGGADYVPALDRFFSVLRERTGVPAGTRTRGLRFLLPCPAAGGACKRAHLFLRWMVRSGDVDLGLWKGGGFSPARLLLPMDTHVHRISRYLGLTARPTADLRAAREATGWLSKIDPEDPVRFDWSLSRLGILAECVRDPYRSRCGDCAVRPVCRAAGPTGRPPVRSRATGAIPA